MPYFAKSQGTLGAHLRMKGSKDFSISSFHLRNSQPGEVHGQWGNRQPSLQVGSRPLPGNSSRLISTTQIRGPYRFLLPQTLSNFHSSSWKEWLCAFGTYSYGHGIGKGSRPHNGSDFPSVGLSLRNLLKKKKSFIIPQSFCDYKMQCFFWYRLGKVRYNGCLLPWDFLAFC